MITYHDIRHNEEVRALIEAGNEALGVLGYTDHGYAHAGLTAKVAGDLLETLGYDERTCELARIAGFMHDIGNAVNRTDHALSGAALAFPILRSLGMDEGDGGRHHRHRQPRRKNRQRRHTSERGPDPGG